MSTGKEGAHDVEPVIEQLDSDELTVSLDCAKTAAYILDRLHAGEAEGALGLRKIRENVANAIAHGEAAQRMKSVGRAQLSLYLLNIQAGIRPGGEITATERSLVVSHRLRPGSDLHVHPERVVTLPPLMGEARNLVWARVNNKVVPLLESLDDRAYQGYVDNWQQFHDAGLPVPPVYLRSRAGTLLIPEVKEDGSEVYGSGMACNLYRNMPRERPRPDIDEYFITLTSPKNLPAIEEQVRRYMERATQYNLQLPVHDPFQLLIRPDGTWELVMRDLRTAKDLKRYPHYRGPEEVRLRNEQSAALWFVRLRILRQYLMGDPPIATGNEQLRLLFDVEPY